MACVLHGVCGSAEPKDQTFIVLISQGSKTQILQEQKREQANNGWTFLAGDRLLHRDVLRALKICEF